MKCAILFAFSLLFALTVRSQGKISGSIIQNDKPAKGATVSLLKAKDSAIVKLSVASKEGNYEFENLPDGRYLVLITTFGYQKTFSKTVELDQQHQLVQIPAISLIPLAKAMADVTVTAKRPLIEQRIDRMIVNVDASIMNTGTSALDVLEKSPGVTVDKDGNISLKGKQGVLVLVDGRPTQLSGEELANLLRNMSSNQLDQIEIMTNPPAQYDAAGTSGVINIKTKKIIKSGFNGATNLTYSQGRYPKTTEGFNFNFREGKVNLFTNLSHNYQKNYSILSIDRNIYNSNTNSVENIFNQQADRMVQGNAYNAKLGIDFFATKKTTFGAMVNLNSRLITTSNPNITHISNSAKVLESVTTALVQNGINSKSLNPNLNFRHVFDSTGRELTADLDFLKYKMDNSLFMINSYEDASGYPYRKADSLTGGLPQNIKVYSGKINYLQPMKKGAKLEAGVKSSVVRTDNNASYDSIQYGSIVHDFNRSNHFVYEENINAAYINLSSPLSKKVSAQFGLRLENTNAKGRQLTTGENFDRHYTQLFPTAFFQYKANANNNFSANFGRRVQRPSYQSLNPFIRFIDRYTYSQGNPSLKPSISNNVEIAHSWKNRIITTLNYSYVKDIIEAIIQQKGQEAFNRPQNVASQNQFGISINANTPINKWWTSSINFNMYHNRYKGIINNAPINLAATSLALNGTQQFKINKTLSAEVNGMYRSGGLEGVLRIRPFGMVGAGLSQQLFKNKATLRLTAQDIFHTRKLKGRSQYDNVDFELRQEGDSQIFSIGFSYRFSKGKKIAPVKRTTGSANEEEGRIGQ